jgi:hypothetical protein
MLEVKTVTRGNSLALSLPKNAGFKKGQRWIMIPSADGQSFTIVPRMKNPYLTDDHGEEMTEEWPDFDFGEVDNELHS